MSLGCAVFFRPDERIKELPQSSKDYCWHFLMLLANDAKDTGIKSLCAVKMRGSNIAFIRMEAAKFDLEHALLCGQFRGIFVQSITLSLEMLRSMKRKNLPVDAPDPTDIDIKINEQTLDFFIRPALWSALINVNHASWILLKL